jgi:hypothetical protein
MRHPAGPGAGFCRGLRGQGQDLIHSGYKNNSDDRAQRGFF